jgi:Helix-turn-helix domain
VPVKRLPAPPVEPVSTPVVNLCDRKSPFATVKEASAYLKESKRTVREMVARGVFKLAPNSNGAVKPWRLLWSEIERHAANQIRKAA